MGSVQQKRPRAPPPCACALAATRAESAESGAKPERGAPEIRWPHPTELDPPAFRPPNQTCDRPSPARLSWLCDKDQAQGGWVLGSLERGPSPGTLEARARARGGRRPRGPVCFPHTQKKTGPVRSTKGRGEGAPERRRVCARAAGGRVSHAKRARSAQPWAACDPASVSPPQAPAG